MTPGESSSSRRWASSSASLGMTPMAGRMWGWLLICEPAEQTAAEIAEALHASRGAISGTARILATAGLDPAHDAAGRPARVLQRPAGGARLDARRAPRRSTARCAEIAERGLAAIEDGPPSARARLQEFHDVMAFVEQRGARASSTRFLAPRRDKQTPTRDKKDLKRMTAIIQTEKLTKSYGEHRGDHRRRPRGHRGRGVRVPRSQRRRQDDDDPDAARPHPADERSGARLRHRDDRRPGRDPPPDRLSARRVRALRPADRRPDASSTSRTSAAASTRPTSAR